MKEESNSLPETRFLANQQNIWRCVGNICPSELKLAWQTEKPTATFRFSCVPWSLKCEQSSICCHCEFHFRFHKGWCYIAHSSLRLKCILTTAFLCLYRFKYHMLDATTIFISFWDKFNGKYHDFISTGDFLDVWKYKMLGTPISCVRLIRLHEREEKLLYSTKWFLSNAHTHTQQHQQRTNIYMARWWLLPPVKFKRSLHLQW